MSSDKQHTKFYTKKNTQTKKHFLLRKVGLDLAPTLKKLAFSKNDICRIRFTDLSKEKFKYIGHFISHKKIPSTWGQNH